jgi:hypothetical protein
MSVIAIAVQAIRDRGTIRPLAVEFILIFMGLAARQLHGAPGMGAEREVKVHRGP